MDFQNSKNLNWVLVNDWDGGKTYIERSTMEDNGNTKTVWVAYYMGKPGWDKVHQKEVAKMFMLEEYDCKNKKFRAHKIFFEYIDGSTSEPMTTEPEWQYATAGNNITLKFLCELNNDVK